MSQQIDVVISYLLHALPYLQSAFNWLLYAYLNKSLRATPPSATIETSMTSYAAGNGHSSMRENGAVVLDYSPSPNSIMFDTENTGTFQPRTASFAGNALPLHSSSKNQRRLIC